MKTVQVNSYGEIKDVISIENAERPVVSDAKVLIKIKAASINPLDNIIRAGYMKEMIPMTFPYIMGSDGAGEIVEIGDGVKDFKVGDAVYFRPDYSEAATFAEYALVSAASIAIKPKSLDFIEAASIPLVTLTAFQAVQLMGDLTGKSVLIHGGSGGVGFMAIQFAKLWGAKQVHTTATSEYAAQLKEAGADRIIDHRTHDFSKEIKDVDFVLDTLGGEVQSKSLEITVKGGKVVTLNGVFFEEKAQSLGVNLEMLLHQASGETLAEVAKLIDEGKIKTNIDSVYLVSDVQDALIYVEQRKAKGKVVLDMSQF